MGITTGVLALLLLAFYIGIRYPTVQTWLAQKAAQYLSARSGTRISIEKVEIQFVTKALLQNFYMEDLQGDTLIAARQLRVDFKTFALFSKEVNIKSILLDRAVVHLHRDSSGLHMNLSEVLKRIAGSSQPAAKDTTKKSTFNWHIDLSDVTLRETDFRYRDEKTYLDLRVYVPLCAVSLNDFALPKKLLALKKVTIEGADVSIDLAKRPPKPDDDSTGLSHILKDILRIEFDELALTRSRFRLTDHNSDSILPYGMDFKHLLVSDINLLAKRGSIVDDTIFAFIQSLRATERSGFEVKHLTTQARVSVNDITLEQLHLLTGNSEVKDYLSFRYNDFKDFKYFTDRVRMSATFNNARFSLKDLNYFVRKLKAVEHNTLSLKGTVEGKVSNLRGRNLEVRTGNSTLFAGDFSTRGLPNIFETSINLRVRKLSTTVADVKKFYPSLKLPPNLSTLGLIYYSGSLDGFVTDFVSQGKLVSAIGSATTDLNFKFDKERNKSAYTGNLTLQSFNLGRFFGDEKNIGTVSLNTRIKGGGLTLESLRAELIGNIQSITLRGYEYNDITIDGSVIKKSFNGSLHIDEPYLKMDFDGRVDLTKDEPEFKFSADVQHADLKNLNLVKQDIRFKGRMTSDIRGTNPDNLLGTVRLRDVMISRDTIDAFVDRLTLEAMNLSGGRRKFQLTSEVAEGEMIGQFSVKHLPKALVTLAKYTFTKDFADTSSLPPQQFTVDVRIFDPRTLTQVIHPQFKLIRNTRITGEFNSATRYTRLSGYVPQLVFGKFDLRKIDIDTKTDKGFLDVTTSIDRVFNGDSLWIDTVLLKTRTLPDKDYSVNLLVADKDKKNYAELSALITPLKGKALVRLAPGDVKLANYHWHFSPDNLIFVEGKKITTQNLVFSSDEQKIYISSYLRDDTATSVKLTLDNTSIADFTGIFTTKMRDLKGSINGKLEVQDVFYKPRVFADFVVDGFMLGKELIGDVDIQSKLDESGKRIQLYASIKSANLNYDYQNNVEARGFIELGDKPSLHVDVDAYKLGLNFLNYKFFERYVKDVRGYAKVKATLAGPLSKPLLTGNVVLINDTVNVPFLNTTYHIHNQRVLLDDRGFDVGSLVLYDMRDSIIYGSGRINHNSFKNFNFDLMVETPNGHFLNTTEKMSPYFYGEAYGRGTVKFIGPVNTLTIQAYAQTKPGTHCRLPITSTYETNKYTFYRFTTKDTAVKKTTSTPSLKLTGVTFILDLDVTPDARMDIILDPVAGDVLTGYGRGNLKIQIPRSGNISMYGLYEIDRGSYLFTLQNIINKKFEISKGGTVNFSGDAYKAALNVDAVYQVRTSTTDLIQDMVNDERLLTASKSRTPVKLLLNLTGPLEKPNVAFDIRVTDPDPTIKSYVEQSVTRLKNYENELNKQVFGLLVMNRFLPQTFLAQGGGTSTQPSSGNYVGGTAANTVSEFLSSQLSSYLNSLLGSTDIEALRNLDISLGYRQYDQATAGTAGQQQSFDTRRELQLALQQRLLNNRLVLNAGTNIDFGNGSQGGQQASATRAVIPTGDFQVEYLLTADGVWRARAFNRTNYDYYNSRSSNRTGVGISYRQEFDKPSELFKRKKPRKKKEGNPRPEADKPKEEQPR